MRFHGDFDFRLRSLDTAGDISDYFALDNADKDKGVAHIIKGQLRYRPEGEQNPKSWGQIDVDVQEETEKRKSLMVTFRMVRTISKLELF